MAILDQMANTKPLVSKPKSKMIRFDPSKSEHRIYELDSETKSNGDHFDTSEGIKPKSVKGATPIM